MQLFIFLGPKFDPFKQFLGMAICMKVVEKLEDRFLHELAQLWRIISDVAFTMNMKLLM